MHLRSRSKGIRTRVSLALVAPLAVTLAAVAAVPAAAHIASAS
jgi:hypothetical protein